MHFPNIVQEVKKLLEESNSSQPPVVLRHVVKLWEELRVEFEDLDGDAYFLDLGNIGSQIYLKKDSKKERQRYSLAHEIGHWVLKGYGFGASTSYHSTRNDNEERWCNSFASELLMPRDWFREDVLKISVKGFLNEIFKLTTRYEVSREAFLIRITEVTPINILKIANDGKNQTTELYKSKEMLISTNKYIEKINQRLSQHKIKDGFYIDSNIYCALHVLRYTPNINEWLAFIIPTNDGSTISSAQREK